MHCGERNLSRKGSGQGDVLSSEWVGGFHHCDCQRGVQGDFSVLAEVPLDRLGMCLGPPGYAGTSLLLQPTGLGYCGGGGWDVQLQKKTLVSHNGVQGGLCGPRGQPSHWGSVEGETGFG